MDSITVIHTFSVFALFGLIWTIQLVHYPMFKFIEAPHWPRFHSFHSRNITFIVLPLMGAELSTSALLLLEEMDFSNLLAAGLAGLSWLMTMVIFIPLHRKVAIRPLPAVLATLVRLNWLRVLVWTLATANVATRMIPSAVN